MPSLNATKVCSVCPTLTLARYSFDDGDFANAGRYLRDAVALFVDALADTVKVGPAVEEDLNDMVDVADAAIRGDDLSVTRPGHAVELRQVLRRGISQLFEFAQSQPTCPHDYQPGDARILTWKGGR